MEKIWILFNIKYDVSWIKILSLRSEIRIGERERKLNGGLEGMVRRLWDSKLNY